MSVFAAMKMGYRLSPIGYREPLVFPTPIAYCRSPGAFVHFQTSDMLGCQVRHDLIGLARSGRQENARIEQFILDASEFFLQTGGRSVCADLLGVEGTDDTEQRVQLIHDPVGLDPQAVFPDLLPPG